MKTLFLLILLAFVLKMTGLVKDDNNTVSKDSTKYSVAESKIDHSGLYKQSTTYIYTN